MAARLKCKPMKPSPRSESKAMADGIATLNEFGHRGTKTWAAYVNDHGVELAMNKLEFTALNEFEVVAVAQRYKREKGALSC